MNVETFKLPLILCGAVVLLSSGALLAKTISEAAKRDGINPPRNYKPLLSVGATVAMCLIGAAFALPVLGRGTWWTGLLAFIAALVISPVIATAVEHVGLTPVVPVGLSLFGLGLGIWWLTASFFL